MVMKVVMIMCNVYWEIILILLLIIIVIMWKWICG